MNNKNIFDALRDIDEEWILDAAPQKRRHVVQNWVKWGSLAACLCVVVAATVGIALWLQPDVPNSPDSGSQPEQTLPHTHLFGAWQVTREATCSEMGIETRLCFCGEQETKSVALLPHFAGAWVVEKEPTIKLPTSEDPTEREPGIKAQFCEHCGAKLNEEFIPATGSLGLAYALNSDGKTFSVAGIGNCTDEDIIIPENFCGYHVTAIMPKAFMDCIGVKSVTLPDTVTDIGPRAFAYCTVLESVTLPEGLESIGDSAFWNCYRLTEITIPTTVTSIGGHAFASCENLKSIVLPEGIEEIGAFTFYFCKNLESIVIPQSVTSIGDNAFNYCQSLKTISLPAGLTTLGWDVFLSCRNLQKIVLPEGITEIPRFSFFGCSNLKEIVLPSNVTSIGSRAFSETAIESITIPKSVQFIDTGAFSTSYNLTYIIYEGTAAEWEAIRKADYWDHETGDYTIIFTEDADSTK